MTTLLDAARTSPNRKIYGVCAECNHKHEIDPNGSPKQFIDWYTKHHGHYGVGFKNPVRSDKRAVKVHGPSPKQVVDLDDYISNADVKIAYAATASPTITLASLAASSTLLGGRESTAIDNGASVKYLDYLVAGNYRAASSNNQAGSIYTCVIAALTDTPTWPDVFDGTDSAETVSKAGVFNSVCKILSVIGADNTASQDWPFGLASVANCFGGVVPDQFVYFVTHNIQTTTAAWNASGNTFSHTPVYATVI